MNTINSIILTEIAEFNKKSLDEIFNELINNFKKGYIYIFIEDLKTSTLIKSYRFEVTSPNKDSLMAFKEKITNKITYYSKDIYKDKYYIHFYFFSKNKNWFKNLISKIFPHKIEKIHKKVDKFYNATHPLNRVPNIIENSLNPIINLLTNNPIKFISLIISIILSYPLLIMYLQGLKPEEINISILSVATELFIILTLIILSLYFLLLYPPIRLMGITTKYIIAGFIVIALFFYIVSETLDFGKIFFHKKSVKEVFQNNLLIEFYLKIKKYPKFAVLIMKNDKEKNKLVLIRFIKNRYIYYLPLCKYNKKIKDNLNVLQFLSEYAGKPLEAIQTSDVKKILDISYSINKQEFYKICDCNKTKKTK